MQFGSVSGLIMEPMNTYSTHPSEPTISSKQLKKLHFCNDQTCKRSVPGTRCFRTLYETIDPVAVYHLCSKDCSFEKNHPNISHKRINVTEHETLPEGLPMIDIMSEKFDKLKNDSWGSCFEKMIRFLKEHRSPSVTTLSNIETDKKVFSITFGLTSEVRIKYLVKIFKYYLARSTKELLDLPFIVCCFDVEGQKKIDNSDVPLPLKIHFGDGWSTFLEINIEIQKDGSVRGQNNGVSKHLLEFFEDPEIVFVGNDCALDLLQWELVLSIMNGLPMKFQCHWVDTCTLWTALGGWAKDSFGLQTLLYHCLGGYLPKHFKLSCAPDWSKPWKDLEWQFNLYNLGDQYTIWASFYTFLIMIMPTAFPDIDAALKDSLLSKEALLKYFTTFLTEGFDKVVFMAPVYQSLGTECHLRRLAIAYSNKYMNEDILFGMNKNLCQYIKESLPKVFEHTEVFMKSWNNPTIFTRSAWTPQKTEMQSLLLEVLAEIKLKNTDIMIQ